MHVHGGLDAPDKSGERCTTVEASCPPEGSLVVTSPSWVPVPLAIHGQNPLQILQGPQEGAEAAPVLGAPPDLAGAAGGDAAPCLTLSSQKPELCVPIFYYKGATVY